MPFAEHDVVDVVRVVRLVTPTRHVDGGAAARQPRLGDVGAIVHVLGEETFLVECVDEAGQTVWLAELAAEELEAAPATDEPRP